MGRNQMPSALIKMKVTGNKKEISTGGKGGIFQDVYVPLSVCVCLYVNMRSIKANINFF